MGRLLRRKGFSRGWRSGLRGRPQHPLVLLSGERVRRNKTPDSVPTVPVNT